MSEVNLIKELRNKTGAGFLDCKVALKESKNVLEDAIDYLRKKGLAKASKKTSREANEGAIGVYNNNDFSIFIKVSSETDFAAKSETFLNFLDDLGSHALSINNLDKLNKELFLNSEYKNSTIQNYFNEMIAKIGENLILSDFIVVSKKNNYSSFYIHNSYRKNIGKIISFIEYNCSKNDDQAETLSKNICMHIAAMNPESLDVDDLDENLVLNEKNIQRELIISSGKPSNIVEKILEGKMKKFFSEVTLLNQTFILDQDKTVKQILEEAASNISYKLNSFRLLNL